GAIVPGHYTVTLCAGSPWVFPIGGPPVDVRNIVDSGGPNPVSTGHEHGNGINIIPATHTGDNTIDADVIPRDGSPTVHITIHVHVIDCTPRRGAAAAAARKKGERAGKKPRRPKKAKKR
ncbi:MAG TPA: hypothetical protein VEU31_01345, partial [Candidatus Acidoferrales bacterium]|nr:hypothetical protein [Candidatus Acidoferrales bacterium]